MDHVITSRNQQGLTDSTRGVEGGRVVKACVQASLHEHCALLARALVNYRTSRCKINNTLHLSPLYALSVSVKDSPTPAYNSAHNGCRRCRIFLTSIKCVTPIRTGGLPPCTAAQSST
ncbi:hypothetical protein J6590_093600 [Homalodisca vitripennis]|nr:hypothetical protein J6590_093600 [Homalodisca vitripennis]